jgi:hypothetical protein
MKSENHKNLFKDGLNSIQDHSAFMEDDWSVLEQRLEKHEGRKKMVLWTKILGAVAAVFLLLLTWVLFQPDELKQPVNQVTKKQPQQEIQAPEKEPVGENLPSASKEIVPQTNVAQRQKNNFRYIEEHDGLQLTNEIKAGDNTLAANKIGNVDLEVHSGLNTTINSPPIVVQLGNRQSAQVQVQRPQRTGKAAGAAKSSDSRLSLSVIYAPALNSVNNFSNTRVGSDVGLLLTVGLSKKWSLTTGAIYAKKLYESNFNDYNPVNKASIPFTPETIYADCRVLDIPLNVNYTLVNKGKNTVSVGTGVSSYLMLKEDYQLRYNREAGVKDYTYSIRNQNKHIFSILNVEAKYERRINDKFGIGLQPYLKVPLSDIGYGNVKLQSLGMAVNFNFNIGGKPKNK